MNLKFRLKIKFIYCSVYQKYYIYIQIKIAVYERKYLDLDSQNNLKDFFFRISVMIHNLLCTFAPIKPLLPLNLNLTYFTSVHVK